MRILQLSKFYPPVSGGIESVVFELTNTLNRVGVRTDVLCANEAPRTRVENCSPGYSVTRVASLGKLLSTSVAPAMLPALAAAANNYDILHVHLPDPLMNLALLAIQPRAKLVVHWHSDIVHQKLALLAYAPLQDWLLRRADVIVATSAPYWQASPWLANHAAKIQVVPIGIRDRAAQVDPHVVANVRARFNGKRILFSLGRMVYYKGFEHLIDAAHGIPEDCVIVIGGAGPLLQTMRERVVKQGLSDSVFIIGNIADDDIPAYYEAAELFCLPSNARSEAFGVVLLEAMSMGKPIIATNIAGSGVSWVNRHQETGLNVPVGDSVELSAAMRKILDDPRMAKEMGRAARNRYTDYFTSARMRDSMVGLYESLLC